MHYHVSNPPYPYNVIPVYGASKPRIISDIPGLSAHIPALAGLSQEGTEDADLLNMSEQEINEDVDRMLEEWEQQPGANVGLVQRLRALLERFREVDFDMNLYVERYGEE